MSARILKHEWFCSMLCAASTRQLRRHFWTCPLFICKFVNIRFEILEQISGASSVYLLEFDTAGLVSCSILNCKSCFLWHQSVLCFWAPVFADGYRISSGTMRDWLPPLCDSEQWYQWYNNEGIGLVHFRTTVTLGVSRHLGPRTRQTQDISVLVTKFSWDTLAPMPNCPGLRVKCGSADWTTGKMRIRMRTLRSWNNVICFNLLAVCIYYFLYLLMANKDCRVADLLLN